MPGWSSTTRSFRILICLQENRPRRRPQLPGLGRKLLLSQKRHRDNTLSLWCFSPCNTRKVTPALNFDISRICRMCDVAYCVLYRLKAGYKPRNVRRRIEQKISVLGVRDIVV